MDLDTLSAEQEKEFDFSGDSTVAIVDSVWTITEANAEDTSSPKGTGTRHLLTFESNDFPYPITVRQFVQYDSASGADTDWVKRSRGVLKNIARAALGREGYKLSELVGKQVRARTREDGDGFATLTRFRSAE